MTSWNGTEKTAMGSGGWVCSSTFFCELSSLDHLVITSISFLTLLCKWKVPFSVQNSDIPECSKERLILPCSFRCKWLWTSHFTQAKAELRDCYTTVGKFLNTKTAVLISKYSRLHEISTANLKGKEIGSWTHNQFIFSRNNHSHCLIT